MRVQVYWNSRRREFSIRSPKTRRVVGYASELYLEVAIFHVSAKGRERVRRTGSKNVHAWIEGKPAPWPLWLTDEDLGSGTWKRVHYNPYFDDGFMVGGVRVGSATVVAMRSRDGEPEVYCSGYAIVSPEQSEGRTHGSQSQRPHAETVGDSQSCGAQAPT